MWSVYLQKYEHSKNLRTPLSYEVPMLNKIYFLNSQYTNLQFYGAFLFDIYDRFLRHNYDDSCYIGCRCRLYIDYILRG